MAEERPHPPYDKLPVQQPLPPLPRPYVHPDEPANVAKRVSDLELVVTALLDRIQVLEAADAPDPLADPPKMLRGRDKGGRR